MKAAMLLLRTHVVLVPRECGATSLQMEGAVERSFHATWPGADSCWVKGADVRRVRQWLLGKGFDSSFDWHFLECGRLETAYARAPEIQVRLGAVDGRLSDIGLQFFLTEGAPDRWLQWTAGAGAICTEWELWLVDGDGRLTEGSELLRVLSSMADWREAREQFDWPYVC